MRNALYFCVVYFSGTISGKERLMIVDIEPNCVCKNVQCPRHGNCYECVKHHRDDVGNLPACLREMLERQAAEQK